MVEPVCYCTENFTCHLHKQDTEFVTRAEFDDAIAKTNEWWHRAREDALKGRDLMDVPTSTRHLACMLATMLDCMQGSEEYCCEGCVVNQIKEWCMEWIKELHEDDHGSHA